MPYAILRRSTDQSIASSSATSIIWDTEEADVGGLHSGSNAFVTLPAGVWMMIADVSFAPNASGTRLVSILENGSTNIAFMGSSIEGSGSSERMSLPIIWVVGTTGNTYEIVATQTSGSALNVLGVRSSYFMLYQLA